MSFELDREQLNKIGKWKNSLPKLSDQDTLRAYTYEFTPFLNESVNAENVSFDEKEDFKTRIIVRRFDGHEIAI